MWDCLYNLLEIQIFLGLNQAAYFELTLTTKYHRQASLYAEHIGPHSTREISASDFKRIQTTINPHSRTSSIAQYRNFSNIDQVAGPLGQERYARSPISVLTLP